MKDNIQEIIEKLIEECNRDYPDHEYTLKLVCNLKKELPNNKDTSCNDCLCLSKSKEAVKKIEELEEKIEELSNNKDTEVCQKNNCKYYNSEFDDNCGGNSGKHCLLNEEAEAFRKIDKICRCAE